MTGITLKRLASYFTSVKKQPASQTCSNTVAWELLFALDIRNSLYIKRWHSSDILAINFKITVYTSCSLEPVLRFMLIRLANTSTFSIQCKKKTFTVFSKEQQPLELFHAVFSKTVTQWGLGVFYMSLKKGHILTLRRSYSVTNKLKGATS